MKLFLLTDDGDTRIGMRLAGIESKRVKDVDSFMEIYKNAEENNIGILLITYNIAKLLGDKLTELKKCNTPLIVEIPDSDPSHIKDDAISEYLSDAIGITI